MHVEALGQLRLHLVQVVVLPRRAVGVVAIGKRCCIGVDARAEHVQQQGVHRGGVLGRASRCAAVLLAGDESGERGLIVHGV